MATAHLQTHDSTVVLAAEHWTGHLSSIKLLLHSDLLKTEMTHNVLTTTFDRNVKLMWDLIQRRTGTDDLSHIGIHDVCAFSCVQCYWRHI